jgi:hypothetical protein
MKRTILKLVIWKLIGFCLVGTCWAQHTVESFARGIARAEGFYIKGSLPARCHNPGDLKVMSAGGKYDGQVGVCKAGHVKFKNDAAGWAALYHQIDKAIKGESKFYRQDMTLSEVAKKYAANSRIWAKNVAHNLGVTPSTTLQEYFELAPEMRLYGFDLRASNRAPVP